MNKRKSYPQLDEEAMLHLAGQLAVALTTRANNSGCIIYLEGNLGAGKTTFSRGFIRGLGHHGAVRSPTFTLVEPYQLGDLSVYHFDLYRLIEPDELDYIGVRDYFSGDSLCLIEWADQGRGFIPDADLHIQIDRNTANSRDIIFSACDDEAASIINQLVT